MQLGRGLRALLLCSCIAALAACTPNSEFAVEAWQDGTWQLVPTSAMSIEGARDGAATVATVQCSLEDSTQLELRLEFNYDPTPVLLAGTWTSGQNRGGEVRSQSVRFAGGQGEGPSIGGLFILEAHDGPHYRVNLPLSPVRSGAWTPN